MITNRINAGIQVCRQFFAAYVDGYRVSRDYGSGRITLEQAREAMTGSSSKSDAKTAYQLHALHVPANDLIARHAS